MMFYYIEINKLKKQKEKLSFLALGTPRNVYQWSKDQKVELIIEPASKINHSLEPQSF